MHQLHENPENQFIHFFVTNHIVIKKNIKEPDVWYAFCKTFRKHPLPHERGTDEKLNIVIGVSLWHKILIRQDLLIPLYSGYLPL